MDPHTRIVRSERAVYRTLAEGEGGVLLQLDTAVPHAVNETGALIWQLLETGPTLAALIDDVAARVVQAPADLSGEVAAFVDDLLRLELAQAEGP